MASVIGEGAKLVSIDIKPENDDALRAVLTRYHLASKVQLIVDDANHVNLPGQFQLMFIDGDHSYEGIKRDFAKWEHYHPIGAESSFE